MRGDMKIKLAFFDMINALLLICWT